MIFTLNQKSQTVITELEITTKSVPLFIVFNTQNIIKVYEYYLTLMVLHCEFQSLDIIRHLIFLPLLQKEVFMYYGYLVNTLVF